MGAVGKAPAIGATGKKSAAIAGDITDKYSPKAGHEDAREDASKQSPAKLREKLKKDEGAGKQPDTGLRQTLAGPLGADPAAARYHTGPAAAAAAQQLQASAFTIGQDVFFGANKYDPTTRKGIGLIAHETTHVLQQSGAKHNDARFYSPRGGDAMEQEAQDTASLVLRNLGVGQALQVAEFVRNYATESGDPVTFQDRSRLDVISQRALHHAQKELKRKGVRDIPPTKELTLDVSLDLAEMSDQEAAEAWGEAIVSAVSALRVPVAAARPLLQKDSTPAPPAAAPTGPDDPETLQVKILDPHSGLNAPFTLRHFSGVMEFDLRALGESQVRLLVKVMEGAPAIGTSGDDSDHYGSSLIWLQASPYKDTSKKFYRTMPQFKAVAAKLAEERKAFLTDFITKAQKAMYALTKESRARVVATQAKYGITKKENTNSSNQSFSYSSSKSADLDKIAAAAKALLPKRQRLEKLMESKKNLASKLHVAFTSSSQLSREEEDAKNLPEAQKEWEKEFGEKRNENPILSQYESADGLQLLADGGPSIVTTIGKHLDQMLVNLDQLDEKLKDPFTIYKLDQGFQGVKKSIKPELTPLQLAYVDMDAADRKQADEDLKLYLTLFTVVVGAMSGGLGGFALLAAEGIVAGVSTYQLIQEIADYDLQSAAHMSDPDLARCLSSTEPSLFWLMFDIVSTVVGLRANVGKMKQAVEEIKNAYKLAQAYGDVALLEKALSAHNVPAETSKKIVNTIYHATTTVANFIRNPDPITAFGVINLFGSFWNLRTSMFKANAPPEQVVKAKATLQEARVKATQAVLDQVKAKYPLVQVQMINEGFEKPIRIIVGNSEAPIAKFLPAADPAPAKPAAGGGTLKGSPAPDGNVKPAGGGTLKGVAPHSPGPAAGGGTLKGAGPAGPPVPEGFYTAPTLKSAVHDPAAKGDPALGKTAPAAPDPTGGKTAPAAPTPGGTLPAGVPPPPDPNLAKTAPADPNLAKTAPAGPALAKTSPAAEQLKAAVAELKEAGPNGVPLVTAADVNILDASAAHDTLDGSVAPGAPMGDLPAGTTPEQQSYAQLSEATRKATKTPGYFGTWVRLPAGEFTVEPGPAGGSSVKYILRHTKTGRLYLFKPAVGEPPLQIFGHKAQGGTLFVRQALASEVAKQMPTVGDSVSQGVIVVHDGRVGSLQVMKEGTKSLSELMDAKGANSDEVFMNEKKAFKELMETNPGFAKFRNDLRAFDHVINNTDREVNYGNILVEFDDKGNATRFFAIDQDATLTPGARNVRDNPLLPRSDLSQSWTDPSKPVMGKISLSLYNEMVMMVNNEASVREKWKGGFAVNDAALDGIFGRAREVVYDYKDRLAKSNNDTSAVFNVD